MSTEYQNIKVWRTTLANLRKIYGLTGEKMVAIVDRLAKEELERIIKRQDEGRGKTKHVCVKTSGR